MLHKFKHTYLNLSNNSIFIVLIILSLGCNKSKEGIVIEDHSIKTSFNLYALQVLNDSIFFIGGGKLYDSGFVYKSTDKGNSWKKLSSSLFGGVYGIYFKDEKKGIGTTWNSNIYSTEDGALTFKKYTYEFDNIITSPLIINDTLIIAVSHNGFSGGLFWKSINGGLRWDTINFERACTRIIKSYNDYFISAYGLVLYSNNQLASWTPIVVKGDLWVDIDFPSYNTGFLTGFEGNILKTNNRGETWNTVRGGNHLLYKSYNFTQSDFINEHIGVVGTYEGDILYTNNGGYSWQALNGLNQKTIRDIHMFNEHSGIAIGDEGTIFKFFLP